MVKEYDFHYWLYEANKLYNPKRSCLSSSFFDKFKKDYRISFRKVNKFVQSSNLAKENEIKEAAVDFLNTTNTFLNKNKIKDKNVWNTDQSGFQKEMHSLRCYTHTNEKQVILKFFNKNEYF